MSKELDELIFEIEDYVAGNIECVEPIDRMAFTVFLRSILTQAEQRGEQRGRIEELKHIDDPVNVNLYYEGLISVEDRLNTLRNVGGDD